MFASTIEEAPPFLMRRHWDHVSGIFHRPAEVARVVASFDASDCFFPTRIAPSHYFDDGGSVHLVVQHVDGRWLGVTGLCVGYGGAGPSYARQTLESLGLSVELAADIASARFSDVQFHEGEIRSREHRFYEAPSTFPGAPRPNGDRAVVELRADADVFNGFCNWGITRSPLAKWLAYMNDPLPPYWLQGPRWGFWDPDPQNEFRGNGESVMPADCLKFSRLTICQGAVELRIREPWSTGPAVLPIEAQVRLVLDASGLSTPEVMRRIDRRRPRALERRFPRRTRPTEVVVLDHVRTSLH